MTIQINGRFDFDSHYEFRDSCMAGDHSASHYIIDMSGTEYMDSSALGMLLLLREEAGNDNSNITISHCRPEIKRILEIAHFNRLFKVE